jgi:hypothetical protein
MTTMGMMMWARGDAVMFDPPFATCGPACAEGDPQRQRDQITSVQHRWTGGQARAASVHTAAMQET